MPLLFFYDHISVRSVRQVTPVDNIPWFDVLIEHKTLNFAGREDMVPHVHIGYLSDEGLCCIEPPTVGVLLLTQEYNGLPQHSVPSDHSLSGAMLPVQPQLTKSGPGLPRCTEGVPLVQLNLQPREESFIGVNFYLDDTCFSHECQESIGIARRSQGKD